MSTFNDIDIECANCGQEFRGTVWVAIHAGQDPVLKDLLLGGELNMVGCPECANVTFEERFLIYQEPAAELVAYVYPVSHREHASELQKLMLSGFSEAQATFPEKQRLDYEPVLFFGLEALIALLRKEEPVELQSQVAQAHCKENKINTVVLRPSRARRQQLLRVIPYVGKGKAPVREDVIAGIDRLLEIDPVLDLYAKLREALQTNPGWTL